MLPPSLLEGIARYEYWERTLWRWVEGALGNRDADQVAAGQWFEKYLEQRNLPTFRHLVEDERALRYLTPILAHSMVPVHLVPDLMEAAIWPSFSRPDLAGDNASEIQQRLIRVPPPGIARAVLRFTVSGGAIARDPIERSIAAASAIAMNQDPGTNLPKWLLDSMKQWIAERLRSLPSGWSVASRSHHRTRMPIRTPAVRFDSDCGRVLLELPNLDDDGTARTWEASSPDGRTRYEGPAVVNRSARPAATHNVPVEAPFTSIHVRLRATSSVEQSWSFPGLGRNSPAIFFTEAGKLLGADGFLPGASWYVLRPHVAEIEGRGTSYRVIESLGPPMGAWSEYVVELIEVVGNPASISIRFDDRVSDYRLVPEPAAARLECPELPDWLTSTEGERLGFEDDLPLVVLPRRQTRHSRTRNTSRAGT